MTMNRYARTYEASGAEATDAQHTLVLLCEGAVRFLHQAKDALSRGDHHAQCQALTRAQRIFSTLECALDKEADPALAGKLSATYRWAHGALTEVGIRDDGELLEEVLEVATGLAEAWRQARQNLVQEQYAQASEAAA
ncbi:MAG: flagellar export chaperone FliS [Armatimonadota bacterium]